MSKIDTAGGPSVKGKDVAPGEVADGGLPEVIDDAQATVLYRKIETKHKL